MAGGSPGRSGWAAAGLGPGSLIAGYRVEDRIGAGGMAMVFRARDEALGRLVALKILPPALVTDLDFRLRFVREARAVAAVDHPHIIPVYAAGEADGIFYLAMRYVTGGDLRSVGQREGPLPGARAAALLAPVASALDAAHAAGLVHRDVKPANILVDARPGHREHPYLSDFGLAKGSASSTGLTGTGQYLGTPNYSAPEQISGKPTGPRADQYALACVAYTILTGSLPFARDESMAVLWAHMYDKPPAVTASRPDLPKTVDEVIARALAKAPDERFPSCGEFTSALRAALTEASRAIRRDGLTGWPQPTTEAPSWPALPDHDTETSSTHGRAQRAQPSSPPVTALAEPRSQARLASPSVPPVTSPAGTGAAAPGDARHNLARRRPVATTALVLVLLFGGGAYGAWRYDQGPASVGTLNSGARAKTPTASHAPSAKPTHQPTARASAAAPSSKSTTQGSSSLTPQPTAEYQTPTGQNQLAWSEAILTALGDPLTSGNIVSIGYWMQNEAGTPPYGIVGANNPINVTEPGYGGTQIQYESPGDYLMSYPSVSQGVAAIAAYLNGGEYPQILSDLKQGIGLMTDPALASEISKYSGGGYTTIPDSWGQSQGTPES
jgi:serine/threonine protein kinase